VWDRALPGGLAGEGAASRDAAFFFRGREGSSRAERGLETVGLRGYLGDPSFSRALAARAVLRRARRQGKKCRNLLGCT
jgi:hypothetical protein